jgi:hypothetical protein
MFHNHTKFLMAYNPLNELEKLLIKYLPCTMFSTQGEL